ncbi:E3 ubiquitin-protein ligase rnf168-like [Onthophagus taurus]|uniref:E3 ubiquitin-protein ligase rnf168-like n=1 Tax=Onthophagus taurus TaxID=166361 RepID=UPI000C203E22|nr:E3 ubiquitin-protein ligase rnf168-like [Onthophagus taurus]
MAPRKRCRSVKAINKDYNKLSLNDVLCPICRNILLEPVSLPCNHGFCLPCFEGTVANSNLTCPLCRIRFASWHRIATKENKIVDESLWLAIKKLFPHLIQNRINGVDNNIPQENLIKLAAPGDIRKEYEEEKRKDLLEIEKQRIAEVKASEELINKICKEEAFANNLKQETLRKDEKIARQLSEQLNSKLSQLNVSKKIKPIEKFLVKSPTKKDIINSSSNKKHVTKVLCQDKTHPKYVISTKHSHEDKHNKNGLINVQKDIVLPSNYYFQPIEIIKTSSHISPIRIPVKQQRTNVIKIVAPKLSTSFTSNVISAFAKVCDSPSTIIECQSLSKEKEEQIKKPSGKKRKLRSESSLEQDQNVVQKNDLSPSKITCQRKSIRLLGMQPELEILPFRGFESTMKNSSETNLAKNNAARMEQERKDLEFAKQLQEELDQMRWYSTRSTIPRNSAYCKKQRQIKLDEIIKCRSKVK